MENTILTIVVGKFLIDLRSGRNLNDWHAIYLFEEIDAHTLLLFELFITCM